jgi:hypothetical protein
MKLREACTPIQLSPTANIFPARSRTAKTQPSPTQDAGETALRGQIILPVRTGISCYACLLMTEAVP